MISNASPLIIFGRLNKLGLLREVLGKIIITEEVYREVVYEGKIIAAPDSFLVEEFLSRGDITVIALTEKGRKKSAEIAMMHAHIDLGEAATIALALQEGQKEVLLDDHDARKAAILYGLIPLGSILILLKSFQKGLVTESEAKDLLTQMIESNFRISARIMNDFFMLLEKIKKRKKLNA